MKAAEALPGIIGGIISWILNPISTGGGGVFSTPCPVNGSELHNGTS